MHEPRPKRGVRVAEAILERHGDAHEHQKGDALDGAKYPQPLNDRPFQVADCAANAPQMRFGIVIAPFSLSLAA